MSHETFWLKSVHSNSIATLVKKEDLTALISILYIVVALLRSRRAGRGQTVFCLVLCISRLIVKFQIV